MGFSEFPSSRIHLWSSQAIGKTTQLSLSNKCIGSIVISEHVLRRTAKLTNEQSCGGFQCFLLGTANVNNDCVLISVDRLDQGKEIVKDGKILKIPTMVIPGDMIISSVILSGEDTITFTTDQYLETFSELEQVFKDDPSLGTLLKVKCLVSLMPDDDLGTPLKVTCEMVYPGYGFNMKPISPLPLVSSPITRALSGDLAGVTKLGYLTLDRARRGVLILKSDSEGLKDTITVGCWISLPLSHPINSDPNYPLGPRIWNLLFEYLFNQKIVRETAPPGPFLLCVLSGGSVLTWECVPNNTQQPYNHIKCSRYVVVPESHISDTTTFNLEVVDTSSNTHKMFSSALKSVQHNLWEKQNEDIEPRSAPSATPSKISTGCHNGATPKPQRSLSPLSILAPSIGGSIFVQSEKENGNPRSEDHDHVFRNINRKDDHVTQNGVLPNGYHHDSSKAESSSSELKDSGLPPDPTYPPNTLLSPTQFPGSPFDPRLMYGRSDSSTDMYGAHSRQGSDPYNTAVPPPGIHSPMSPYYYNPYIDHMRYQYPYHPYPPMYHHGLPHNVPAFYPPNYSPSRRSKKPSKEKSAFKTLGRTSPNKRTNHRSPEKSSFSSANKSVCSTSTVSSRDSANHSARSRRNKKSNAKKQLYPDHQEMNNHHTQPNNHHNQPNNHHPPRSLKSSASSSVSERRKGECIRDVLNKSSRSSRTPSSQSESASISAKALKMLTLQKRQLDHLQQQVSLLMKNAHTTAQPASNVENLDKSIESMRNQMEILEQQIDKGVSSSTETNDMCVGTGESLILTSTTGTNMTQHQICDNSVQCTASLDRTRDQEVSHVSHVSHVSERSAQCSETASEDQDPGSFYLRFKENEDPQKSNGWDSYVKFDTKEVTPKYKDHSIYQHPKIQTPSISHSIYNSVYFEGAYDNNKPSSDVVYNKSPSKEFSLASRKYLEKHQLISPPTKQKNKKKSEKGPEKYIYKNGKILQLRKPNSDAESLDLQRLKLS